MEDADICAASTKPASLSGPPKFKSKTLVDCQHDSFHSIRGVVIECSGSSVTVLTSSNHVKTYSDDNVSEAKTSFAVVAQDKNGRSVRYMPRLKREVQAASQDV
jgi:hypothetical protein